MNRLIIVGAGGHGRVVADIAVKNGYTEIGFLDDHATGKCMEFPIWGTSADIVGMDDGSTDFVIGIGNNAVRERIARTNDVNWVTLIHPSATVAIGVRIGKGSVVMAGAVINACATVGEHCIVNTSAVVEHDNVIEDYVHVSPGARLGGMVRIGRLTHVGIGATVINNVDICEGCIIGAGAVVIRSLQTAGTYVGVPVRMVK